MSLRAVLDTNVLVSGLGWSGSASRIVDAVLDGRCTLVTSPALLAELRRVLGYPKLAAAFPDPDRLIELLTNVAEIVIPDRSVHAVRMSLTTVCSKQLSPVKLVTSLLEMLVSSRSVLSRGFPSSRLPNSPLCCTADTSVPSMGPRRNPFGKAR